VYMLLKQTFIYFLLSLFNVFCITGINMPSATSVMMYDSMHLTPLMFRQMAGRAGRRGFDNVGHVVFVKLSRRKISELMLGELSELRAQNPVTMSFALRAMTLYDNVSQQVVLSCLSLCHVCLSVCVTSVCLSVCCMLCCEYAFIC
jgi:superfamily II DNA or RNA helicase